LQLVGLSVLLHVAKRSAGVATEISGFDAKGQGARRSPYSGAVAWSPDSFSTGR
jgi:hypothetical protein